MTWKFSALIPYLLAFEFLHQAEVILQVLKLLGVQL